MTYKELIHSAEETIITGLAIGSVTYMAHIGFTGNETVDIAAIGAAAGLGGYNLYAHKNGGVEDEA